MKKYVISLIVLTIPYIVTAQEKPTQFFFNLLERYKNCKFESKEIESNLDDGMSIMIFENSQNCTYDVFCQVNMFGTLGQTQYLCYKKFGTETWFVQKKALFYDKPYTLEGAEIKVTHFMFENNCPYVFNDKTERYDIRADTNKYPAIVDIRSLSWLIDLVKKYIPVEGVQK